MCKAPQDALHIKMLFGRCQQLFCIRVLRMIEETVHRPLLHNAALLHHQRGVAQLIDHVQVVGDEEIAQVQLVPQLPQQLVNVRCANKQAVTTNAAVQKAVEKETQLLGETGRVLLRPSGTEPLVRVMAEAATQQQADEVCDRLAKIVAEELA